MMVLKSPYTDSMRMVLVFRGGFLTTHTQIRQFTEIDYNIIIQQNARSHLCTWKMDQLFSICAIWCVNVCVNGCGWSIRAKQKTCSLRNTRTHSHPHCSIQWLNVCMVGCCYAFVWMFLYTYAYTHYTYTQCQYVTLYLDFQYYDIHGNCSLSFTFIVENCCRHRSGNIVCARMWWCHSTKLNRKFEVNLKRFADYELSDWLCGKYFNPLINNDYDPRALDAKYPRVLVFFREISMQIHCCFWGDLFFSSAASLFLFPSCCYSQCVVNENSNPRCRMCLSRVWVSEWVSHYVMFFLIFINTRTLTVSCSNHFMLYKHSTAQSTAQTHLIYEFGFGHINMHACVAH